MRLSGSISYYFVALLIHCLLCYVRRWLRCYFVSLVQLLRRSSIQVRPSRKRPPFGSQRRRPRLSKHIYIYIYIERERDVDIDIDIDIEYMCIYIYI